MVGINNKDTIIAAQEAEILRLQQGFEDLKNWALSVKNIQGQDQFDDGLDAAMAMVIVRIDKITGAKP